MQDSPSDRKNMANALAPVCEGRSLSGSGRFGRTLARHFGCVSESTQGEGHFNFISQTSKYVLLNMSRMLPFHPLQSHIYSKKKKKLLVCWSEEVPLEKGKITGHTT